MTDAPRPYNPLDRVELGKSVERALLAQPLVSLGGFLSGTSSKSPSERHTPFRGAGLYALYYTGELPWYEQIAPPRREIGEIPIYVGRAQARGSRQGAFGLESTTREPVLYNRLREHARSVEVVGAPVDGLDGAPLSLDDFVCRYLVADDIWVPLGEALLIGHYRPVWNVVVDGFGNHAPGSGRGAQARSMWDTLHPGRSFAFNLPSSPLSVVEIVQRVVEHLADTQRPNLDTAPVLGAAVRQALAHDQDG